MDCRKDKSPPDCNKPGTCFLSWVVTDISGTARFWITVLENPDLT